MTETKSSREILFEYARIGNIVRVTAIDAESGTEVVFQAPSNSSYTELQRIGINKMKYVLNKERDKGKS